MDVKDVFKLLREIHYDSELTHAEKVILTSMVLKMDNPTETVKSSQAVIYNNCGVSKKAYYAMIKKKSVNKYFTIKKVKLDRVDIKMRFPLAGFPEVTEEFPEVTTQFPEETPRKHHLQATFDSTLVSTDTPKETSGDLQTLARASEVEETQSGSRSDEELMNFLKEFKSKQKPEELKKRDYFNEPKTSKYDEFLH
jgi:hypothetical protein